MHMEILLSISGGECKLARGLVIHSEAVQEEIAHTLCFGIVIDKRPPP